MGRRRRVIEAEVYAAIKAAPWLEDTDRGAVRVALRLAEQLDKLYEPTQSALLPLSPADHREDAGKVGYLAMQMLTYLDRLLLTARARLDAGPGEDSGSDLLATVRELVTAGEDRAEDLDAAE